MSLAAFVNRTLHKGFRLGKLRALLPLTCSLLGSRTLMREVAAFWSVRPPSGFYFLPEAVESATADLDSARRCGATWSRYRPTRRIRRMPTCSWTTLHLPDGGGLSASDD